MTNKLVDHQNVSKIETYSLKKKTLCSKLKRELAKK